MESRRNSVYASSQLRSALPDLKELFDVVGELDPPKPELHMALCDKVVHLVAGQMLSNKAAQSIVKRLIVTADVSGAVHLIDLSGDQMRECGLSGFKIKAIEGFASEYRSDQQRFASWSKLTFEELKKDVSSFWGLSTWTAEMLAVSHYGHRDIYPTADGTIQKVTELVKLHLCPHFDPLPAAPNRTLLACYLWESLDSGYWNAYTR